jgi:serine/threonine-protein kinase
VCPDDASPGVPVTLTELPAALAERFSVREPFAVGATGTSFRIAAAGQPDRLLKVISASVLASPAEAARLRRDLQRQSEMNVPSLGRVLEFGIEESVLWLLREFAPGESLATRMRRPDCRTGLPLPAALAIAAQLSAALDELHRVGLLQRDLKAGHVIVADDGEWPRVRLIDAGVAAEPALVAPELEAGSPPSFRTDLYALGCVLHQALSGSVPDGRDFDLDWPRPLAALLASLLAHDPNARPASAQQVRRTLGTLLPSDAPEDVRGSWPAPGAARGQVGDSSQAAVPKFRAGVGKMSDKTQEISLGEMEAADPLDAPTQEIGPAEIAAAVKSAQESKKSAAATGVPASSSVTPPPPAAAIRQRLSTRVSASPPPPPPESLVPSAQRKSDSQRPAPTAPRPDSARPAATASKPDSVRPSKAPSSRPAPPPAAFAHRTSGAPPRANEPTGMGTLPPPPRPSAVAPSAAAIPSARPAKPDFTKTMAGLGGSLSRVPGDGGGAKAPAPSAYGAGSRASASTPASTLPNATSGDAAAKASELDALRGAAARSGSTQRGILQPSAAESPSSRRPGPEMPSRKATELGMPAVRPRTQPPTNGGGAASIASSTPTLRPAAIGDSPADAAAGEGVRARVNTAPLSMRDPALDTAPGTLSAVRKADASAAATPNAFSRDAKLGAAAGAAAVVATGIASSARAANKPLAAANGGSPHEPVATAKPASSEASPITGANDVSARQDARPIGATAADTESATDSYAATLEPDTLAAESKSAAASHAATHGKVTKPASSKTSAESFAAALGHKIAALGSRIASGESKTAAQSHAASLGSKSVTGEPKTAVLGSQTAAGAPKSAALETKLAAVEAKTAAAPAESNLAATESKPAAVGSTTAAAESKPAVVEPKAPVAETKPAATPAATSAPIAAAAPGASFDVEALFDDKLAPERAVISRPNDATDPKTQLDREPAEEVTPSTPARARRSRGLQSWPLLAAAAVLGLVAMTLSFRACGSSDSQVASTTAKPNLVQPATPVAPAAPPPAAAAAPAPADEVKQPAAKQPEAKQPEAVATAATDKPATAKPEAKPAAEPPAQTELAGGKTLTAQQARPVSPSLRGGVVPYRANSDPQVDYKAKGRELYSAGKYKEAADAYQHASQAAPSDAGAFAGLGASWLAAAQPDKAISAYQRALQLKPEVSGFQAALGRAYLLKGDKGRAASAYRKALDLDPQNSAAKTGLASVQ